ncbi:hypothetical protein [Aeromonas caviae]|uniref:hypothetical protein n=1 Tax=Aeromonas caviae TaxID=648 RepID=UPI0038D08339
MKLAILDQKVEAEAICYLCRVNLADYIISIPDDYKNFDIQRGIVSNKYLDHLVDTVGNVRHIPPIVLVTGNNVVKGDVLELEHFKILDGLQRTHRLKLIYDTINTILSKKDTPLPDDSINTYYRSYSSEFKEVGANRQLIKALAKYKINNLNSSLDFFKNNTIWVEVWSNLSNDMQIKKMLLLNAGHKSVNIKHQLELLFLGTLFKLEEISTEQVTFVREKDTSANQYSKNRLLGQYHFSHIISSLISLCAGKIVNTNTDFVSALQSGDLPEVEIIEGFNIEFLKKFIHFIYTFDTALNIRYGEIGLKWLGREVVLVGFFGALGAFAKQHNIELVTLLDDLESNIYKIVEALSINEFEIKRNQIELNKVNIGAINKRAVYQATYDLISKEPFSSWEQYFGGTVN